MGLYIYPYPSYFCSIAIFFCISAPLASVPYSDDMDKNDGTPGLPLGVAVVEPVRAVHFGECDVTHLAVGIAHCTPSFSSFLDQSNHTPRCPFFSFFFFLSGCEGDGSDCC